MYWLPVLIGDSGSPSLSSTNMLSIRVCDCDPDGVAQACGAEAYTLPAGLSTGALVAILACVLTLLGESPSPCPSADPIGRHCTDTLIGSCANSLPDWSLQVTAD